MSYKREIDVCEAIGRVEGVHSEELRVGDAYCTPTAPFPSDLTVEDWMAFLNALAEYMEVTEMQDDFGWTPEDGAGYIPTEEGGAGRDTNE